MPDFTPITETELLDANYRWFILGRHQPSGDKYDRKCFYRSPHGGRCAIGCTLPDALYDPEMEGYADGGGKTVARVLSGFPMIAQFFSQVPIDRLMQLQWAHDKRSSQRDSFFWTPFREDLMKLAQDWGLDWTPPNA